MHQSAKQANAKLCGRYTLTLRYIESSDVIKFVSIETEHKISLCTIYMGYTQELDRIMETLQMLYTFINMVLDNLLSSVQPQPL
jgi:hypothetical protein